MQASLYHMWITQCICYSFWYSVSTALDEAATALTRMKSEKQTYEAFLKGASQAPSPPAQHEPPLSNPVVPSSTGNAGMKISANVTIGSRQQQQLKQTSQQQQAPVADVCNQTPPLPPQAQAEQPHSLQEQASDSMQSLQRLLTQGGSMRRGSWTSFVFKLSIAF